MLTGSDLELFVAIAETGSLTAAARKCGVTRATITRHLELLEARLATPLVNRTTRNVSLTEAGNLYLAGCRETLARLRHTEAAVQEMGGQPRGVLRVACPILSVDQLVGPLMTSFAHAFPEVEVHLHLSSEPQNPLEDGCDVALHIGEAHSSALISRCLLRVEYQLVASPGYLERRGTPRNLEELAQHDAIVTVRANGQREPWPLREGGSFVAERPKLCANAAQMVRVAALDGLGIALIAEPLTQVDIASGTLQRVLWDRVGQVVPVSLTYSAGSKLSPKMRAFVEHASSWVEKFANRA
jgi:DNA-binding transcriptional LysR family regulator